MDPSWVIFFSGKGGLVESAMVVLVVDVISVPWWLKSTTGVFSLGADGTPEIPGKPGRRHYTGDFQMGVNFFSCNPLKIESLAGYLRFE